MSLSWFCAHARYLQTLNTTVVYGNKKSNLLFGFVKILLLYFGTEFPEFRCKNMLCVAGCYRCNIAANL